MCCSIFASQGLRSLYSVKMSRADRNPWLGKMVLQRQSTVIVQKNIQMFDQIFTIHVLIGYVMLLLVFSLLPKRHIATYKRFFTLHKRHTATYKRFFTLHKRHTATYKRFFTLHKRHTATYKRFFTLHKRHTATYKRFFTLHKRHTATYKRFFTLLNNIASRHNFNFLPEKLVLTSSVHPAMQLQTHFKRTKKYREIDERSTTLKTLSMVTQLRIC